jgi:hypothetical protein
MKKLTFRVIVIVLLTSLVSACASLNGIKVNMSNEEQKEWYTKMDTAYNYC